MRTIETTATITPDGTLTVKLPPDIEPGQRQVVVVIGDAKHELTEHGPFPVLDIPAFPWGNWPDGTTFRREELYGDDGR